MIGIMLGACHTLVFLIIYSENIALKDKCDVMHLLGLGVTKGFFPVNAKHVNRCHIRHMLCNNYY